MSISMHDASVPVFRHMLGALAGVLRKGEAHAADSGYAPDVLLQTRLFPDMFPLARQVQIATDFARSVSARLADIEVPSFADEETTFEQLHERIARTLAFIDRLDPVLFEGSDDREIVLRPGTPKERRFDGKAYLLQYGLPQFFFHVTTAYALLRHSGVPVGKLDYMGAR